MGRVQGGARAAFATPSWGPSRIIGVLGAKPLGERVADAAGGRSEGESSPFT